MCPARDPDELDELHTADLLEQARGGNPSAWEVIYRRYRMRLLLDARGRLRGRVLPAHDTEDIVQSAFLAAWGTIRDFQYRGEGSFRAWLRKLVVRRVLSRLRERAREGRHMQAAAETQVASAGAGPGPQEEAERADGVRRVLECLEELPEIERDIVVMRSFERKRWTDVAECCGRSRTFVEAHYKLAFKRLARCLGADGADPQLGPTDLGAPPGPDRPGSEAGDGPANEDAADPST